MTETAEVRDQVRWQIEQELNLYKFYLDLAIKAAVLLLGLTGALISYYFNNPDRLVVYALLFAAVVDGGFAILFGYSVREATRIEKCHDHNARELGIESFSMSPLRTVCLIFTIIFGLATVGLLGIFFLYGPWSGNPL